MTTATLTAVDRLGLGPRQRRSPLALGEHLTRHGPLTIPAGDDGWSTAVRQAVTNSGLAGRGGGGFPSAAKWAALRRTSRRPVVVVNALEGEPASAKDRTLLARAPHLVLDGAEVVAAVVRAREVVVCLSDRDAALAPMIDQALSERRSTGAAAAPVSVRRAPGRYVTGEESALASWLGGGPARPAARWDKSVPLRTAGRPVLVHNAETLAHVALIVRHGPDWFRRLGPPEAPGTTLVTVTGGPGGPGVLEVELGTTVGDIFERAGVDPSGLAAVLVGGYGGAWLDGRLVDTPYAPGPLRAVGATSGVGVLAALAQGSCGVAETARIIRYLAGESAGQCGPCVFGLPAIADDLELLAGGDGHPSLLVRIAARARAVDGRGACRHPDGAARLVRSALEVFGGDAGSHARGRPCAGAGHPTVLPFPAVSSFPERAR